MIIKIGYWFDPNAKTIYPMPVENSASASQKKEMLTNLKRLILRAEPLYCKGFSTCRICFQPNGSKEFSWVTNGNDFRAPEGLLHYVTEHNVLVEGLLPGSPLALALNDDECLNSRFGLDKL